MCIRDSLYSGGLDSLLAARVLMDQGLSLLGLRFLLPFEPPDLDPSSTPAALLALDMGLPLRFIRCGLDYIDMVKNPGHGYGIRVNPCIDCKIYFLRKAAEIMKSEGALFVATGEVVGQRPMSQMKHMLNHIEKESGLKGYLLRPLSAKLLKPTVAETSGAVDRERLWGISGRSRSVQLALAGKYGITGYSSPAGGCLFTDAPMEKRIRDLFDLCPDHTMTDFYLLTVGRHYRLSGEVKIIVGRNEKENLELRKYRDDADLYMEPAFKGPDIWVRGEPEEDTLRVVLSVMSRYGVFAAGEGKVLLYRKGNPAGDALCGKPCSDRDLERMRI